MIAVGGITFDPALPWAVLIPLFALAGAVVLWGLAMRARGAWLRLVVAAVLAGLLLDPAWTEEQREPLTDIVAVVVDESPSQALGDRPGRTDRAVAELTAALADRPGLEVRLVRAGGVGEAGDGGVVDATNLMTAAEQVLADVPRSRVAGTVLITDGQVHDLPEEPAGVVPLGPVHALLTGEPGERDRRLVIEQAPAFGVVGEAVTVQIRIEDLPTDSGTGRPVRLTVARDGLVLAEPLVITDRPVAVPVPIDRGGPTVVEIAAEPWEGELSTANNRVALTINGVRDRLRVLLVSGLPHPGERTWRNILKSDPSVDLVHFTILRPAEKQDGTPIEELSLIAFPIRELFELRLDEFDLIIFDRYRRRGVLPPLYFYNIRDYVERGGAFLEASGPAFAGVTSIYRTALSDFLPGTPTGDVVEAPFLPRLTELGRRHPVTAVLGGADPDPIGLPDWGRWFRQISVDVRAGETLLSGTDERPLLILDRFGEGRVAQLATDQIWLWSRGYDGGGPHAELLRRMVHWLMREPALEEEDLRARAEGDRLFVERRSLDDAPQTVTVTTPAGALLPVTLDDLAGAPGVRTGELSVTAPGVYRVEDGARTALAVVGAENPPELQDLRSEAEPLRPVAEATGGSVRYLSRGGLPEIRHVDPDRALTGSGFIGLRANGDYAVTGVRQVSLLPAWIALALALAALMATWRREAG